MPAKYHPVSPMLWDRSMRTLSTPAKLLRLYVLTCSARVSEGLYQLPLGIAAHDLDLETKQIERSLAELESAGLVDYDYDAEVVLDRTALKFQPLRNGNAPTGEVKPDKRIAGALSRYEQTPDSPLKAEFFRCARQHSPDLAYVLGARWPELTHLGPVSEGIPGGHGADAGRAGDTPQQQAPSKPLPSPRQGASRAELIRDEVRLSGSGVQCGWCGEPALTEAGGGLRNHRGRPWCGWCEPSDDQEDRS